MIIRKLLITLLSLSFLGNQIQSQENSYFSDMYADISYHMGKFIGVKRNYTEVGLFLPVNLNSWEPFVDVRGYRFDQGKWASSAGLGVRKNFKDNIVGINAYYDYRRSHLKKDFHRLGMGLEWLTNRWDFRINGYMPIWRQTQRGRLHTFDHIGGGFFASRRKHEFAFSGFDAEVGIPFFSGQGFCLYGAAGPYYYFRRHEKHFWGGYGRVELNLQSLIFLQLFVSHDHVFNTNVQGVIQFFIPFDFFCSSYRSVCECNWLFRQPVQRNGIIQMDHCCDWKWNW